MKLEDIKPFIRHVSQFHINSIAANAEALMAYDNCLLYAVSGYGHVIIENEIYDMSTGSILLWKPGVPYHISVYGDEITYVMVNFDFTKYYCITKSFKINPEPPGIFYPDRISDTTVFIDNKEFNNTVYVKSMRHLEETFISLVTEFKKREKFFDMRASSNLIVILIDMLRELNSYKSGKHIDKSDDIIEYIHEHYCENISNTTVASFFNFHPQHINKLVKNKTGYSLHKYIIMRRISKAIDLLETTKMQVSEIAFTIGFQDICHFSRYFKAFMGVSPREFRSRNQSV